MDCKQNHKTISNEKRRFSRKKYGDANTAALATTAPADGPNSPGDHLSRATSRTLRLVPSGGLRCPQSAPLPQAPSPNSTHREFQARPGVGTRGCRGCTDQEGGRGEKGATALTPPGPQLPNQRGDNTRQHSSCPKGTSGSSLGILAVWKLYGRHLVLLPRLRSAGSRGLRALRTSRRVLWESPRCWLAVLASGLVRCPYISLFFSSIQSSHRLHIF